MTSEKSGTPGWLHLYPEAARRVWVLYEALRRAGYPDERLPRRVMRERQADGAGLLGVGIEVQPAPGSSARPCPVQAAVWDEVHCGGPEHARRSLDEMFAGVASGAIPDSSLETWWAELRPGSNIVEVLARLYEEGHPPPGGGGGGAPQQQGGRSS